MSGDLPLVHLKDFEPVSAECLERLPLGIIRRQLVVPISLRDGRLLVAVPHTNGVVKPEGLQMLAHCPVDLALAPVEEIVAFIRMHYDQELQAAANAGPVKTPEAPPSPALTVIRPDNVVDPVVNAPSTSVPISESEPLSNCPASFCELLSEAAANKAREVLIEREGGHVRVRQRIRGVLVSDLQAKMSLEEMNEAFAFVAEKGAVRSDGGVRSAELALDVTLAGESHSCRFNLSETEPFTLLTVRLSPLQEKAFDPVSWGMGPHQARTLEGFLGRRHGLLLFTGSDNADVAATMNACLRHLLTPDRHVIAVQGRRDELLRRVEQFVSVGDPEQFARHLQLAVRHNPDVLMVNPLDRRDHIETCLNEALRGRLILGGLHGTDAADAIVRTISRGVEPYLVVSALVGVIAQRSLRLNCPRCQEKDPIDRARIKELGIAPAMQPPAFYKGRGCESCAGTGFDRETMIFEVLDLDEEARTQIQRDPRPDSVRQALRAGGLMTLRQLAIHKAINGQTSLAEVLRATA